MRILLVEDNANYGAHLFETLSAVGQTSWLTREREFIEYFAEIEREPPDIVIIDIMLAWDVPRRDPLPPPPTHRDMYLAGIRCAERLNATPATKDIPILLYSIVSPADVAEMRKLPSNVHYLEKSSDPAELISAIRYLTRRDPSFP